MYDSNEKFNEVINSEILDIHFALNILINAVGNNWEGFNKVDKYLIGKVLNTLKYYSDNEKDLVIKFSKNEN